MSDEKRAHALKTWQPFYAEVERGDKTFEVRRDDRDFRVGDTLVLCEWDQGVGNYTGRKCYRRIGYVLRNAEPFGVQPGFAVLSLEPVS